jgi:hypothetical protein
MPGDNAKIEPCTNNGIRVLFLYGNNVSPVSAANHAYNTIDTVQSDGHRIAAVAGTALYRIGRSGADDIYKDEIMTSKKDVLGSE